MYACTQDCQMNFHKYLNWKDLPKLIDISQKLQNRTTATTPYEPSDARLEVSTLLNVTHRTAFPDACRWQWRSEIDLHVLTLQKVILLSKSLLFFVFWDYSTPHILLYPPKKLLWSDVSQMLSGQGLDPTLLFRKSEGVWCICSVTVTDFIW